MRGAPRSTGAVHDVYENDNIHPCRILRSAGEHWADALINEWKRKQQITDLGLDTTEWRESGKNWNGTVNAF